MIDHILLSDPEELVEPRPEENPPASKAAELSAPEIQPPVPAEALVPEGDQLLPELPEPPGLPEFPKEPEVRENPDLPKEPESPTDPEPPEDPEATGLPEDPAVGAAEPEQSPEDVDAAGRRRKLPYHQRSYLLYAGEPEAGEMDLDGTIAFLQNIGFDGGELRQARRGKEYSAAMKSQGADSGTRIVCSYCGEEISGVDYYRMPDGRMRCSICSRTLVKTKEELTRIYKRILNNMEVFFGASFTVPVNVEMMDERNLKKKLKRPLSEVDDKSFLLLGVAVNRKKDYSVYLENGAPRIAVIATFAHELTHIWQYTHWTDPKLFPKLSGKERLLIYEGMAKWAEIQYLYLVGETSAARREEEYTRTRKDEYGIGFCLYENRFPLTRDAMICGETPFRTDGYPLK